MKKIFALCGCVLVMAGCAGAAPPTPTPAPKPTETPSPAPGNKELPIVTRPNPQQPGGNPKDAPLELEIGAVKPNANDKSWSEGAVFITDKKLMVAEGSPRQAALELRGNLPTPCNMLRVAMDAPDASKKINLRVYSVSDPNRMCAAMLSPLNARIRLGELPAGTYTFTLNGEDLGKLTL